MNSIDRICTLAALGSSPHQHKGIRPTGAADQEAPCAPLNTHDARGFYEAAAAAEEHWPDNTKWDLVASDFQLQEVADEDGTDGMVVLGMPVTLGTWCSDEGLLDNDLMPGLDDGGIDALDNN